MITKSRVEMDSLKHLSSKSKMGGPKYNGANMKQLVLRIYYIVFSPPKCVFTKTSLLLKDDSYVSDDTAVLCELVKWIC